jgi:sulfite reductase alpha subunit-like flavoprotein
MAGSSNSSNEDSDLEEERSLTVLYATQSGNAQDVAERIGRQARRRHVHARIHSMDEYDIVSLKGREYSRNYLLILFSDTDKFN